MSDKKNMMERLKNRNNSNFENKGKLLEQLSDEPLPQKEQPNKTNNIDIEINSNIDSNINGDFDNDNEIGVDVDIDNKLDSIFGGKKRREDQVSYRGFYIENDLIKILDKLGKRHGKGVKSELINGLLRKEFQSRGLLK